MGHGQDWRRPMNLKQTKRIRKLTNSFLRQVTGMEVASVKDTAYDTNLVPSNRKHYAVQVPGPADKDGKQTYVVHKDTAIQIRLKRGIGRGIYKRIKQRVSSNRRALGPRVLSGLRDDFSRAIEAAASRSVEHAGAASVQREHRNLPVM